MNKHTPGPWFIKGHVNPSREGIRIECAAANPEHRGYQVADALDANGYPQNEANARLIAAAPELLDALTMVRDYIVTMKGAGHEYQIAVDAAIAKATGAK